MSESLDDDLHARVVELFKEGDAHVNSDNIELGLGKYEEALALLPLPHEKWEASTLILAAMGDAHFFKGDYVAARDTLQRAMHCPDAIGNSYLHLRLGEVQYELGNTERAKDELARAYLGGGPEVFEGDDPKYLRFIMEILRPGADEV